MHSHATDIILICCKITARILFESETSFGTKFCSNSIHPVYFIRNLIFGEGFRFLNFLKPFLKG